MAEPRFKPVQIPFDRLTGHLVCAPEERGEYLWREAQVFAAEMQIQGFEKTRQGKGARFLVLDIHSQIEYGMSVAEMANMLKHAVVNKGHVIGDFCVYRVGKAYSLRYLEDGTC